MQSILDKEYICNVLDLFLKRCFRNWFCIWWRKILDLKQKGTKSEVEGSCSDQSDLKMLLIWIYVDYLFQQSGSTICSLTHLLSHSSAINKNYRKRCFKILISCLTDLDDCVFSEHNLVQGFRSLNVFFSNDSLTNLVRIYPQN